MWLSDISVRRPVLATVVNALLVVFGVFALMHISVREYPDIDSPIISVNTAYQGASASVVETKITQLLEDRISGIEGIRTMTSSSSDGNSKIAVEFDLSRDIEAAASDVRDRVARVLDELPIEADSPWLDKADADASPIMQLVLSSDRLSSMELTDYAERYVVDRFSSITGVSRANLTGARTKSMRVWLDRQQLAAHELTALDVEHALTRQNVERPAGRLESLDRELTLRTSRPFTTAEEFSRLAIARGKDGYPIKLGDVSVVEVSAKEPRSLFRATGVPAVGLSIVKQSKANTLEVARAVKVELARLEKDLPAGTQLRVNVDDSQFIEAALHAVVKTLIEAGVIVIAVTWLFLGSARATLIPAITVPISLLASFIFLSSLGFSLNILTMLALVLAIGLVVDDAIVVVENIHRRIELGEPPLLAAFRGTREVGFAVVATTLVLCAVFTPLAFLQGDVGRLFREFALALAGAVFCSGIVALTLSPAMAAWLLKPQSNSSHGNAVLRALDRISLRYRNWVASFVDRTWLGVGVTVVLLVSIVLLFRNMPSEVTPAEDRGQFQVQVTAPQGASFEYTSRYLGSIENLLLKDIGDGAIERTLTRVPTAYTSADVNSGLIQVSMADWNTRTRSTASYVQDLGPKLAALPGVRAVATQRRGFRARGAQQPLQFVISGPSYEELAKWRDKLLSRIGRDNPNIQRIESDFEETKPTLAIDVDLNRAADMEVSVESISRTLETILGGRRITTFNEGGREYDVILQAGIKQRAAPTDLENIYVRSDAGQSFSPLANLIKTRETAGPASYNRVDRMRSITLSANLAPGYALSDALSYIERIVDEELPSTARLSYTGQSRELKESSGALFLSFALALLVVFLVLAALFESWVHPLVIMTTVPLAVFGALLALASFGYTLNIYSQIGVIMLVGLAAKNGILIVDFANKQRDAGVPFRDALLEAATLRLRPILMTSLATAVGVVPLMLAGGAGSEARANLGLVVFWGVLFSTLLTLFVVPAFYALLAGRTGSPGRNAARLVAEETAQSERSANAPVR